MPIFSARAFASWRSWPWRAGLLLAASAVVAAQGSIHYLQDSIGTASVAISPVDRTLHALTAADAAALERNLARVRDLLLAQPVFHPLIGARVRGDFRTEELRADTAKAPVPARAALNFLPAVLYAKSGPGWAVDTSDQVVVYVNNPTGGLELLNGLSSDQPYFYEPARAGEMDGFPVFRGQLACEYIVLSRSGRLPWVPVTREEYVQTWTRIWQARADSAPADTMSPKIVARHKAVLAAMSPEERAMQARSFGTEDPFAPTLAPPGSTKGHPLVKADPAWFDASVRRTAIQLIVVKFWYSGELDPDHPGPSEWGSVSPLRVWETLHHSNWREIGAALEGGRPAPGS